MERRRGTRREEESDQTSGRIQSTPNQTSLSLSILSKQCIRQKEGCGGKDINKYKCKYVCTYVCVYTGRQDGAVLPPCMYTYDILHVRSSGAPQDLLRTCNIAASNMYI